MKTLTLKPGLLVALRTTKRGGVEYQRRNLDVQAGAAEGAASVEKWETTKVVADQKADEEATKCRSKCRSIIASVCSHSEFGLLCPVAKKDALDQAIEESKQTAAEFNAAHETVQIGVYVLTGQIAESDTKAAKEIAKEIKELLDDMRAGVAEVDVQKIRDAALKAKSIGKMLDGSDGQAVTAAIEAARSAAKEIVKQVSKGADKAEVKIEEAALRALDEARFAFLDYADEGEESGGGSGEGTPEDDASMAASA